jgi:hypothetical protein
MTTPNAIDPATQRLLAGELAKSLWATAKPQSSDDDDSASGGAATSGVDTFSSLFTDVLADAMAGGPVKSRTSGTGGTRA